MLVFSAAEQGQQVLLLHTSPRAIPLLASRHCSESRGVLGWEQSCGRTRGIGMARFGEGEMPQLGAFLGL